MDKEDALNIIALLQEIRDLSQHQAQYLQEIRDAVAGDPMKKNTIPRGPSPKAADSPNKNLFDDVRRQNNID